jgi:hypothetical protein
MMHDRASMIFELILVTGTPGAYELLAGYEEALADLDARAHWGQYNTLTNERIQATYPRWDEWMSVERQFNSSGVFDSPFTQRVGISD